jgi:tetratricopeptide (TPR) repeat protein
MKYVLSCCYALVVFLANSSLLCQNMFETQLKRANELMAKRDFEGAMINFDRLVSQYGTSEIAWFARGCAKQNLGEFKSALEDFTKSYQIKNTPYALYGKAEAALEDQQYQIALDAYTQLIEAKANEILFYTMGENGVLVLQTEELYFRRAVAKYGLKDFAGAVNDYESAIKAFPDAWSPYTGRAAVLLELEPNSISLNGIPREKPSTITEVTINKAMKDFDKALSFKQDLTTILLYRSHAKANIGDFAGALEDSKAVIKNGDEEVGCSLSAWYSLFAKDFKTAIQYAKRGLSQNPKNTIIQRTLAHAYLLNNQLEESMRLYDTVRQSIESKYLKAWQIAVVAELNGLKKVGLTQDQFDTVQKIIQ